jgi:photosystem II stability/assembly factor-like uncharacterized protein
MRTLLFFLVAATAFGQGWAQTYPSNTTEGLRGVSAVSKKVAWASGTHGTYLRTTDGGRTWTAAAVPEAGALDFRAVVAFSADEAFLMSAGPGDQSRIYHTADAGQHWQLQFRNENPKGFFDSMVFWDATHGIVLGDPIADEGGVLRFDLLITHDGQTWARMPPGQLPPAMEGEGAFAASNSCLAVVGSDIWFATGGRVARVFHSGDRGLSWQVVETPIVHGPESAGIFSIAFRDSVHGVIAGGDYKHPEQDGPNLAFTDDGGKTWTVSKISPQSYYSAVGYDRRRRGRVFIVGPKFVLDLRLPESSRRVSEGTLFNAVSAYPGGGAVVVGPKGAVGVIR